MDKQELIDELKKEIEATKNVSNFEEHVNLYEKGKRIGLEIGWMFAEKLDEPKITEEQLSGKKKLIKAIENHLEETRGENAMGTFDQGYEEGMDYATVLIEHYIKEPEQVVPSKMETTTPTVSKKEIVVPQFVGDYIEKMEEDRMNIFGVISSASFTQELFEWCKEKDGKLSYETLCRAWLDGYAIEQPKLLTVIVKDYDKTIMSKQVPEDEVNKMMEGFEK